MRNDCALGFEFSGKHKHFRFMGIVKTGELATTVLTDPNFLWKVPDKWTLEEAATIPLAYVISYYALFVRGKLKTGESILIHNGTDHVSLAAITIAQCTGCTIFITVYTQTQRQYIKKIFPKLTDEHIGNIQDNSFEHLILTETQDRGVDVELNLLPTEKLQPSLRCLANGGRFLDLKNNAFSLMSVKNVSFHFINRCLDLLHENCEERTKVLMLVEEGINKDVVQPLPRIVFPKYELQEAFKFQASQTDQTDYIRKVLLKIQDEKPREEGDIFAKICAVRRVYMNPNKSYVLIGGLGGFGLELANWLIVRGAKYIVLVSRLGLRTGYQAWCVQRWRKNGIDVVISTEDITTSSGARSMIEKSHSLAPIGGIFNLAAVLRDKVILNLQEKDFETVMLPKIDITRNLDAIPEYYYSQLDYFIVFSSMTAGRGNAGQCNYGFANSAVERMIEQRHALGKPGLVIQWSAIADVGLITDTMGHDDVIIAGIAQQRISSCFETLDIFLQLPSYPVLSSMTIPEKHKSAEKEIGLVETVAAILGIRDINLVNPDECLNALGMDSLKDIEVKQTFDNYNIVLSAQEIRVLTISKLYDLALQHSF